MINEKIDIEKLLESLTEEIIIELVSQLGADRYINREDYIIFPTICHNEISEEASMKLYYYKNSKLFHCYTQCNESFNIFGLYQRVYEARGKEISFYEILCSIANQSKYENLYTFGKIEYKSEIDKYKRKNRTKELEKFDQGILNIFQKYYPIEWLAENITKKSMDKYNILYSTSRNKIIIPHYDINSNLVGIRGRALNQYEIDNFGKYMPVEIEGKWYTHPLSYNLYGLNISKETIKKEKIAIIYEGEKSVIKHDGYFPDWNVSVASCGSTINKSQLDLLIKNFDLKEIIIAFDKEYKNYNDEKGRKYFDKLKGLCKKYTNYCNFSFIFDKENLLLEKDSPIDQGKEKFEELFKKRIKMMGAYN